MKTVISASRRTDIPAFYMDWFVDTIKKKNVQVQNPFYKNNYITVDLSPSKVEWIVFWSRNYENFLKKVHFFHDYNLFFHFTILSHHAELEKTAITLDKALIQMEKLVITFGADRIIWRYDPIVIWRDSDSLQTNYNEMEFIYLCKKMKSYGISRCYFSFVTNYSKFQNRFNSKYPSLRIENDQTYYYNVLKSMKEISKDYQIKLFSCCNDYLTEDLIQKGSCISGKLLNTISGSKKISEAKSPTRQDCGCTKSIDVGNYTQQPCYFGCIYCYANPVWK